jgi:PAS domain S-box-containing protein
VVASIFVATTLVDFVLLFISPIPTTLSFSFLDAVLTSIVLFPLVYYVVFEPMKSYLKELERSRETLQLSEAKYRSLVEGTDDSIYLVNKNCEYLFMNTKHRLRLGFSGDEYIGRKYREFHSSEETGILEDEVRKVFETGESLQHEHRSQRDNLDFFRTLSPIKAPNGVILGVSVVSKNVSKLKR